MPVVYDNTSGRVVGDYRRRARRPSLGARVSEELQPRRRRRATLQAAAAIDDTLGGKIWRLFHPAQEQSEYETVSNPDNPAPPPTTVGDVVETASRELQSTTATMLRYLLVGGIVLGVVVVSTEARKLLR